MRPPRLVRLGAGLLVSLVVVLGWFVGRSHRVDPKRPVPAAGDREPAVARAKNGETPRRLRPLEPRTPQPASTEEKSARVDKIKRDYDELRTKVAADYSAAGAAFPGGLHAFLRQLALLEREKRADLGVVLSPRELEDLEMTETTAGQLVDRLLGPTAATVAQRRTVFQLERQYEEDFALSYDLSPPALLAREAARQKNQQQIYAVLGDDLFGSWLYGEGEDYALSVAFAARHGLAPNTPLELRLLKNELTLRRLALAAQSGSSVEQDRAARDALAREIGARLLALIGPAAVAAGRSNVLAWLPVTQSEASP